MATIELYEISKNYGRKTVLQDVTLRLTDGLTVLVGPSGAGTSTLLRLLATAERPSGGTLRWNGVALPPSLRALRSSLGYAPQAVDLPEDLTAREFGRQMAALKGLDYSTSGEQFGFIIHALGLSEDIDRRIATFSGGMRRRLILSQALLGEPELLILDEPTAELDAVSTGAVLALVRQRARSAIVAMTTHLPEGVEAGTSFHVENGQVHPL